MEDDTDFEDLMRVDAVTFTRIMDCVFGVKAHETHGYLELLSAPGSTVEELADTIDRDRSTTQRSLATLREKGLVERERRLVDGGGYVYQYTACPLDETKRRMHDEIDEWAAEVHEEIDKFSSRSE